MISLDNYILTFEAAGGDLQINYTSDNPISKEAISSTEDWITAEVTKEGAQEGHILIHVSSNNIYQRSATLTFTAYDQIDARDVSATIEVNQLPVPEQVGSIKIKSIEIDGKKVTSASLDENTHILKVTLETSLISTVNVSNTASWISLYSQGDNEYIFNISANTDVVRGATITFNAVDILGNNLSTSLNVSQAAHYEIPISFKVDDLYANNTEQVYTLNVKMLFLLNYEITEHPSWVEIQNYDSNTITLKVLSNPTYKDREGKIIYSATNGDGNYYTFSSNVFQLRTVFAGQYPTWQDVFVEIPRTSEDENNITYSVSVMNNETNTFEVVYRGNAVFTEEDPEINITEIVRDYVEDNINIYAEGGSTQEANLTKVMLNTDEPEPNLVATLYYYYDYSFDKDFKFTRNMPILNHFDTRQDIFLSFLNLSGETNNITISTGGRLLRLTLDTPGIFHNKRAYHEGDVIVNAPDKRTVLTSKNTCAKYAIYYLNPLGGWDQLLIEGKVVKTIKLENKTFKRNFDNNTNDFQNKHYLKNLTTSYKFTTGYLTDDQAKLMPNLIETTKAYLCELDTNTYIPVLINNNSVDIKTYRNQGRKLFTYTIDVQESQNKFIK